MAYSDTVKAAVITDLLLGVATMQIAEKHGVAKKTVQRWKENVPECASKKDLGELVAEHMHLELETLGAIARHAADQKWLRAQRAGDVATLYGVMSDKLHVKLAAWEAAGPDTIHRTDTPDIQNGTTPQTDSNGTGSSRAQRIQAAHDLHAAKTREE